MRKVTAGLNITLDGVVEAPEQWSFNHFDQGVMEEMQAQLTTQDTILLGKTTYEQWAGFWPTSPDEPFASFINNTPKYVVSTTLNEVTWKHSTLLKGSLTEELTRLKRQPGKTIGTAGSPTLVQSLLHHNLLDELTLIIYPVVAGKGKRLFNKEGDLQRLKLVNCKATSTGVMILTYQPGDQA
jgi:dihydrofolate reductase